MRIVVILLILMLSSSISAQKTQTILFESDQFFLQKDDEQVLQKWYNNTLSKQLDSVHIYGYTNDIGSLNYNLKLSEKRAEIVHSYLVKLGLKSSFVAAVEGKGEIPLDSGKPTQDQRINNRKVEVIAYTSEKKVEVVEETKIEEIQSEVVEQPKDDLSSLESGKAKAGEKINLKKIVFEGGRRYVLPQSVENLVTVTKILKEHPEYEFEIQGHVCCLQPGEKDGEDLDTGIKNLSMMRAKQVYDYFIKQGIDPDRMTFKGMGGDYPLGGDPFLDRRVEIVITKVNK